MTAAACEYGARWLFWRALYEVLQRTGLHARRFAPPRSARHLLAQAMGLPPAEVGATVAAAWRRDGGTFFLLDETHTYREQITAPERVLAEADAVAEGRLLFFRRQEHAVGNPPRWLRPAGRGADWPGRVHWSRIPDLSAAQGDIKLVWEPARFAQTYPLARAYALTRDERYPELFWTHVESWVATNPPELGPHWRCGQEMSLRCLAWVFGLYAFGASSTSTQERVAQLIEQLWYHARHIERIHWYAARCVQNNHAISEAVGLFTIGTLFPFLPRARRWQASGVRSLEEEAGWQIYADGSYVQHSTNYARMVSQLLTWAFSIARSNAIALPASLPDRARRLLRFLLAMQDVDTGRVPNYGPNDGALIFPLSSCDYPDYRPALNSLGCTLGEGCLYPPGPWDEEAAWFRGRGAAACARGSGARSLSRSQSFPVGGYFVLRGRRTHAIIRCASYRHRPLQADMLHLDVWYRGHNVLVDPGTFSYNLEQPWSGYFIGTASHNTVTVDGRDQMKKGSRFMWLGWTKSRVVRFDARAELARFEGEHHGYAPVIHRRRVILHGDTYLVVDELAGETAAHTFRLHWLVNDFCLETDAAGATIHLPGEEGSPLRLTVFSSAGGHASWARSDEATPRGWQSLYYGERLPAWSYEHVAVGEWVRFATLIGPADRVEQLDVRTAAAVDRLCAAWEAARGGEEPAVVGWGAGRRAHEVWPEPGAAAPGHPWEGSEPRA